MEEFHPHSDRETLEPIRLWLAHCISDQAMTIHDGGGGGKTVKMTKMGGLEEVVSCGFGKLKKKKKFLKDGEVERVLPDTYQ